RWRRARPRSVTAVRQLAMCVTTRRSTGRNIGTALLGSCWGRPRRCRGLPQARHRLTRHRLAGSAFGCGWWAAVEVEEVQQRMSALLAVTLRSDRGRRSKVVVDRPIMAAGTLRAAQVALTVVAH